MIRKLSAEEFLSSPDPTSVATFLEFLKRDLIGDAIVHHELLPAVEERLVHDCQHLGPNAQRVLRAAGIEALAGAEASISPG